MDNDTQGGFSSIGAVIGLAVLGGIIAVIAVQAIELHYREKELVALHVALNTSESRARGYLLTVGQLHDALADWQRKYAVDMETQAIIGREQNAMLAANQKHFAELTGKLDALDRPHTCDDAPANPGGLRILADNAEAANGHSASAVQGTASRPVDSAGDHPKSGA